MLLQDRYDALPPGRIYGSRDGSGLTDADLPWLVSNGFVRTSRRYRTLSRGRDPRVRPDAVLTGVPRDLFFRLPAAR